MAMVSTRTVTLLIRFMDGSKITLRYPKQAGNDQPRSRRMSGRRSKPIGSSSRWTAISFIPLSSVKYFQVLTAPDSLPEGVLRGARMSD
jgi:hypothetical protein